MLSFGDEKIPSKVRVIQFNWRIGQKAIKKGIPTSTTTKTAGVGDRKRSSDQSPEGDKKVSLLMKRSKRNVASRHEEDEVSSPDPTPDLSPRTSPQPIQRSPQSCSSTSPCSTPTRRCAV